LSVFGTRVLLATDGSPESVRAARMATELSNKLGSEMHLVYVEPMPDVYGLPERVLYAPDTQNYLEEVKHHAQERIDEEAAKIRDYGGEVAAIHPKIGRPDAEIVQLAEELDAGLVVVGSRGFGPFKRILLGSVSESVVRHANTSVLVARGEEDRSPGRVFLAIDGSKESHLATRAAVEITSAADLELHVLSVLEIAQLLPQMPYPGPEAWETSGAVEEAEQRTRRLLSRVSERIEAEGGTVKESHLAVGKPDKEIVRLAGELGADLVVLGSRGFGAVGRILLGSVSDSVVRHVWCSVLVVRGEERGW
jgi:nucleotide-binding universal stress UspA family protein